MRAPNITEQRLLWHDLDRSWLEFETLDPALDADTLRVEAVASLVSPGTEALVCSAK